jgi:hypothetical protein
MPYLLYAHQLVVVVVPLQKISIKLSCKLCQKEWITLQRHSWMDGWVVHE